MVPTITRVSHKTPPCNLRPSALDAKHRVAAKWKVNWGSSRVCHSGEKALEFELLPCNTALRLDLTHTSTAGVQRLRSQKVQVSAAVPAGPACMGYPSLGRNRGTSRL